MLALRSSPLRILENKASKPFSCRCVGRPCLSSWEGKRESKRPCCRTSRVVAGHPHPQLGFVTSSFLNLFFRHLGCISLANLLSYPIDNSHHQADFLLVIDVSIVVFRLTKRERCKKGHGIWAVHPLHPYFSYVFQVVPMPKLHPGRMLQFWDCVFQRIYFLEVPIPPCNREWRSRILALNDWTGLLLAAMFLLTKCFHFATLHQLWPAYRDLLEARMLLSVHITNCHRESVCLGISDEKATAVWVVAGGTSFAIFSRHCAKIMSGINSCHLPMQTITNDCHSSLSFRLDFPYAHSCVVVLFCTCFTMLVQCL